MYPYIDFHTHSEWNGDDTLEVVSIDCNKMKQAKYYTIGYHPWWISGKLSVEQILILQNTYMNDPRCLGIGECGLEILKGMPIGVQEDVFLQQIDIANALNAPMVIHCVRAFDRVLHMKKTYGKTPWVIHGFVRNKILAKQVLDTGCYLSVAPSQKMAPTFYETLAYLPSDRFFIETDSDFSLDIKKRYAILAKLRNCKTDQLKDTIFSNFAKFYSEKWKYHTGWKEPIC